MIAVCRGTAKAEALKRLGADEVIDQSADSTPLRTQIKVCFLSESWGKAHAETLYLGIRYADFCSIYTLSEGFFKADRHVAMQMIRQTT